MHNNETLQPATGGFSSARRREGRCSILSISAWPNDHLALRHILNDSLWQITNADSFHQAIGCLCRDRPDLIICERDLPDGSWRDLLSHVAELMDPPALIVTSEAADKDLHSEVLTLGGFHVFTKPFHSDEVRQVVAAAWRHENCPLELATAT